MSRQLLGYLVTCALLTGPLPPLAQLPARMPRRGWVEGQHIAMVSRSGVRRMRGPQAASPLTLGVDRHLASTPAVYTRRCGARLLEEAPTQDLRWRRDRACRAHAAPGRWDAAAWLAMLECHRAKPYAIFVPPAISPGGPARTTDTWPGREAGTVLTSRARGGLVRPLGMAVQTCRALDPYA